MGEAPGPDGTGRRDLSWRLEFYRRVGQAWLTLGDVDAALQAIGGFTRVPDAETEVAAPREGEPPREVVYRFEAPGSAGASEVEFEFGYLVVTPEEDPGRADFPFEAMPFELRIPFFQGEPAASRGIDAGMHVAEALDLLVLDPQVEQETPGRPDRETLIRSYTVYNRDVEETLAYVTRRGRTIAKGVLVILVIAIAWLTLALLSRG